MNTQSKVTGKHTPGPWSLEESVTRMNDDDIGVVEYYDVKAGDDTIAEMVEADSADLIAAAPELLGALLRFERVLRESDRVAYDAEAWWNDTAAPAIQKAIR